MIIGTDKNSGVTLYRLSKQKVHEQTVVVHKTWNDL